MHMSDVVMTLSADKVAVDLTLSDLVFDDQSDALTRFASMGAMFNAQRAWPRLNLAPGYGWAEGFSRYDLSETGGKLNLVVQLSATRKAFDECAAALCGVEPGRLQGEQRKCGGMPVRLCEGQYTAVDDRNGNGGKVWKTDATRMVLKGDPPKKREPGQVGAAATYALFSGESGPAALATADWIEAYAEAFLNGNARKCRSLDQQIELMSGENSALAIEARKRLRLGAVHALMESFDPEHLKPPARAYVDSYATKPEYDEVLPSKVPPASVMAFRAAYEVGMRAPDPALDERLDLACGLKVSNNSDEVRAFCALLGQ